MPTGPKGEKRPAGTLANALLVGQIATGESEETYVDMGKRKGGQKGGRARAANLPSDRRSEIAHKAAKARWDGEER